MIKIPYEQVIGRIVSEANLSEPEVQGKIDAKMKQLSGLISKEGAAHIVANELGIKLLEQTSGKLQIKNIMVGIRNVEVVGKVMQAYELREFNSNGRQGKVANFVLGDETGTIRAVMWGDQAENINKINPGDIIKVVEGYVRENQGKPELHINERSSVVINPPGETVNVTVTATARSAESSQPAAQKPIKALSESDSNVALLGTIVQVFEPRFFVVHPQTGRKLVEKEGTYYFNDQRIDNPAHSYVMNVVIDDGTETMRAVFFRETVEKLLQKKADEILTYKDDIGQFQTVKNDLLGNIIKVKGRVNRNTFFDRLEFVANDVTMNPNPDEEIKRLNAAVKEVESN